MKEINNLFTAYSKLIKNTDNISQNLSQKHQSHMQCRIGCDMCCMEYNILPLEFHYILEKLKKEGFNNPASLEKKDSEKCIFLDNGSCTIYNYRPMICRTHGLPLLYTNDDYEWELSTCELNFRAYNYENFSPENTFPQDKYNSMLFMLNKEFTGEFKEKKYKEFERVPMRKLADNL